MPGRRCRLGRAVPLAGMILCGGAAAGQDAAPLPELIPGGSDTRYDVLGLYPGMGCEAAHARVKDLYGRVSAITPAVKATRIKGQPARVPIIRFHAERSGEGAIKVECTTSAGAQVYRIERFVPVGRSPIDVEALRAALQEKYGFLSKGFRYFSSEFVFGAFFNTKGPIDNPTTECGRFGAVPAGGAILDAEQEIDPDRCSFAVTMLMIVDFNDRREVPPEKKYIANMRITIIDYMRLVKADEAMPPVRAATERPKF